MIDLLRRRQLGDSVSEFIDTIPYFLDSDGESLWHIVPGGRSFGFEGDDLTEFVRLCVLRLLNTGGIPVRHAEEGELNWTEQAQYGTTTDEIANAIVAEWLAKGGGDPKWDWLWFVTRRVLHTSRHWQAEHSSKR
ncbi:MAG: hypothetical protein WC807_13790 [Hyphomicrobium sp.]|jgi:hypothetical protein